MNKVRHWIPAAYCAVLSVISALTNIYTTDHGGWIPFFGFMPLCFMFVGYATKQMHSELRELRVRVAELEKQRAS
jgi:hypothetical protein